MAVGKCAACADTRGACAHCGKAIRNRRTFVGTSAEVDPQPRADLTSFICMTDEGRTQGIYRNPKAEKGDKPGRRALLFTSEGPGGEALLRSFLPLEAKGDSARPTVASWPVEVVCGDRVLTRRVYENGSWPAAPWPGSVTSPAVGGHHHVKPKPRRSIADPLVRSLEERWARFRKKLRALRKGITVDAVHDERTASRRLLSTLGVVEPVVGRKRVQRIKREVRKVLSALGPLRDVHVELERTRTFGGGARVPQFRSHLHRQASAMEQRAGRRASRVRAGRLRKAIRRIERRLVRAPRRRSRRLLRPIDDAFRAVIHERKRLDPTDVATMHRFRVSLKNFRYAVEALQPLLRGVESRRLDQLRDLQDSLGELHDLEVLSASFRDFILEKNPGRFAGVLPVQKMLLARHHDAAKKAIDSADRILEYWGTWSRRGQGRLRRPATSAP